jgi:hypothetical protein
MIVLWVAPWKPAPDNLCDLTKAAGAGLLKALCLVFLGCLAGFGTVALPLASLVVWLQTGYFEIEGVYMLIWLAVLAVGIGMIGATGAAARSDFGQVVRGAVAARAERFCPRVEYRA